MPGGRPSPIDTVIAYVDRDGQRHPITVAERIINGLLSGNYFEHATASAGITKETGYEWLRTAGRALIRAKGQDLDTADLTPHERRCVEFSDAVANAEAQWVVQANATLELLGRGGAEETTTTEKYDMTGQEPKLLERTVKTVKVPPNAQVIEWRLTRRFPSLYGNRLDLTLPPGGALTSEERASELITGLESFLADVDAAAEVRATRPRKAKSS